MSIVSFENGFVIKTKHQEREREMKRGKEKEIMCVYVLQCEKLGLFSASANKHTVQSLQSVRDRD